MTQLNEIKRGSHIGQKCIYLNERVSDGPYVSVMLMHKNCCWMMVTSAVSCV